MRRLLAVLIVFTTAATNACSDGDEPEAEPTAPATIVETRTSSATPDAERSSTATVGNGESMEVQGVVGAVDARAGTIEVRATGGSPITTIEVGPGTTITRAGGGTLTLEQVRPSDRVSAKGVAGSDAESLIADEITVQQVVPGGPPGANPGG